MAKNPPAAPSKKQRKIKSRINHENTLSCKKQLSFTAINVKEYNKYTSKKTLFSNHKSSKTQQQEEEKTPATSDELDEKMKSLSLVTP
jgi:hypothetical protein